MRLSKVKANLNDKIVFARCNIVSNSLGEANKFTICCRRSILVIVVWIWNFIGFLLTALPIAYIKGIPLNPHEIMNMFYKEPYLASYIELSSVGGLPLIITLLCRDNLAIYGLRRSGLLKSIALSSLWVIIKLAPRIPTRDWIPKPVSFNLQFPLNIWYAILGVLTYGPLEVFFVIWLIVNTDYALKSLDKTFSPGLIITAIIFGLSHIIFSPSGGILNTIDVTITFLILGLIFKYSGNSMGPMIAWTLINRYVIYLVAGCLTFSAPHG